MNEEEKKKLAAIPEEKPTTLSLISEKQVTQMQENILELSKSIKSYLKEHKDILSSLDQSVIKSIKENAKTLADTTDAVTALAIANNTENIKVQEKAINDITKALAKIDKLDLSKVTITNPTDTTELAKSKDFIGLEKAIVQVSQRVNDLTETLKPNQAPEEFIPYRRVKKRGNQFVFDDDDYSRGGGGGSSSSSTGGNVVITDAGGEAATVTGGKLDVNATVTSSGGAILDGVDNAIKSTVFDYTSSNPVAVRLTDTNGDYIAAGAGTQYTEDVASAADPIGTQLIARRRDTLASETTTDGDNTAVNSTAKGELYVKHTDSIPVTDNGGSLTVDGTVGVSGTVTVDASGTAVPITDNSGSLTVDNNGTFATQATVTRTTAEQGSLSAGSLNADLVASTDVTAYKWFSVQITGTWSGTITFQGSNDNSNFVSFGVQSTSNNATASASTTTSNGIYYGSISFKYLRIRMTSYSSGTANGTLELYDTAANFNTMAVAAGQNGTWTVQPGNTANTTAWKVDGSAVTQPVSGTVTANLSATDNTVLDNIDTSTASTATNTTNIPNVVGTAASAIPSKLLQVGGSDGTNARAIKTNTSGQLDVRPLTTSDAITTTPSVVGGGTEATAQRVTIASDSTGVLSVDDNGGSLTVDGTVATSNFPTTVDTNSGNKSASTLRVVLATDQPALTNKLLVTPDANSAVNVAQIGGNNVSAGVGTSGTGTLRVVQANDAGKTLLSKSGSASTSGNNTLVAAGTNRLKVFAFSLTTTSTTAVTCKFQDGASGTDLWSVVLQAPSGANTGANLVVNPPAWLFATTAATLLNLNLSSANAVQWSVSYFDEA